eukprot:1145585-Pelagomonas_calceolata.AAC.2
MRGQNLAQVGAWSLMSAPGKQKWCKHGNLESTTFGHNLGMRTCSACFLGMPAKTPGSGQPARATWFPGPPPQPPGPPQNVLLMKCPAIAAGHHQASRETASCGGLILAGILPAFWSHTLGTPWYKLKARDHLNAPLRDAPNIQG